jgi:hypothetical protein
MQSIYERGHEVEETLREQQSAASSQVITVKIDFHLAEWLARRNAIGKDGDASPYAGR